MSLHDSRILTALIRAKARLALGNGDNRPRWSGVICPSCGVDYRTVTAVDGGSVVGPTAENQIRKVVMGSRKTSKASSAEAILRQCLRNLGFTVAFRQGTLSNEQLTRLLDEVRQYGRAWLRHEAEGFVKQFSRGERGNLVLDGTIARAATWIEGHGGYLIQQDAGFRHALGRFFSRSKQFVRELILAATLSMSGQSPLTGEELSAVDAEAKKQEQFFDQFQQKLLSPPDKLVTQPVDVTTQVVTVEPTPMTPGQFIARAESYADSSWQAAQRIDHGQSVSQGTFKFERRVLGTPKTEHCEDCPPLADLGWQPIGTLPEIGDSACGSLCLCHFRYSEDGDTTPEYFQGKRGPLRAPSEVSILEDDGGVEMIAEPPGGLPGEVSTAGPP